MTKNNKKKLNKNPVEKLAFGIIESIGSPFSIICHTLFFVGIFGLHFFGFATDNILLILTTAVSLEAIYLSIFIQMTVNRNTKSLEEVEEDIEEIQEDVEGMEKDIDEIQEDIDEIQEEDKQEELEDGRTQEALTKIESGLQQLLSDFARLKKQRNDSKK
jgi:low affinity Fe/Cu permease